MVTYINRYKDEISFEKVKEDVIQMSGGKYSRVGFKDDAPKEQYTMVDPSGGPYIAEHTNMGCISKEWSGDIVDYITIEGEEVSVYNLHLKVKETTKSSKENNMK
jgi:hypothetical protein